MKSTAEPPTCRMFGSDSSFYEMAIHTNIFHSKVSPADFTFSVVSSILPIASTNIRLWFAVEKWWILEFFRTDFSLWWVLLFLLSLLKIRQLDDGEIPNFLDKRLVDLPTLSLALSTRNRFSVSALVDFVGRPPSCFLPSQQSFKIQNFLYLIFQIIRQRPYANPVCTPFCTYKKKQQQQKKYYNI